MSYIETITLISGILVVGTLTAVYVVYIIRKNKIINFIVNGTKEIKRLHYTLKFNKFKIIDVNKNYKFKIDIDNKIQKYNFKVTALAKKKKRKYLCFIQEGADGNLDYEMLYKTRIAGCRRGLIINPETFNFQMFKI